MSELKDSLSIRIEVRDKDFKLISDPNFEGRKYASQLRFNLAENENIDRELQDIAKFLQVAAPERIFTIELRYFNNISKSFSLLKSLEVNQGVVGEILNY